MGFFKNYNVSNEIIVILEDNLIFEFNSDYKKML